MRKYDFPQLDNKDDALCRDLFIQDDSASRINPNSVSRKEMRRLLAKHDLQVVALLRNLLGAN